MTAIFMNCCRRLAMWLVICLVSCRVICLSCWCGAQDLLHIGTGTLPIVISAPHGGTLPIEGIPPRTGRDLPTGPSGFFAGRDSGTEELALLVVEKLHHKFAARPSFVISGVHRKYVDFNRPIGIAVEHPDAAVVYDSYHSALKDACRQVKTRHGRGLLIDIHGQGSSSVTVFRGTKKRTHGVRTESPVW